MTPEQEGARAASGRWVCSECGEAVRPVDSQRHDAHPTAFAHPGGGLKGDHHGGEWTAEQEAGEGVARTHARFEECRKVEKLIEAGKLAEAVELAQDRAETVWNDLADIHAAIEVLSDPSPHEGEAARSGREWTLGRYFPDAAWTILDPADHDTAKDYAEVVTVRETAPTEPRSISEEHLGRMRAWVEGRPHSVEPRRAIYADRSDVHALLADREHWKAAYEQAEARVQAERDQRFREVRRLEDQVGRANRAEAERDTAQASEARLREALARIEAECDAGVRVGSTDEWLHGCEFARDTARAALACDRCEGDGSYSEPAPCTTNGRDCACNGPLVIVDPCPDCNGTGRDPAPTDPTTEEAR